MTIGQLAGCRSLVVERGRFPDADALHQELVVHHFDLSGWAAGAIKELHFTVPRAKVEIVMPSAQLFGFDLGAPMAKLVSTAERCGLDLCSAEDAPLLALAQAALGCEGTIIVPIRPLFVPGFGYAMFSIQSKIGANLLREIDPHPSTFCLPEWQVAFQRNR